MSAWAVHITSGTVVEDNAPQFGGKDHTPSGRALVVLRGPGSAIKRSCSVWDKPLGDIETSLRFFDEATICMARPYEKHQWLLDRYRVTSDECLMVGNSFRSDVLPVTEIGGRAVHVPYEITWEHEHVEGNLPKGAVSVARLIDLLGLETDVEGGAGPERR